VSAANTGGVTLKVSTEFLDVRASGKGNVVVTGEFDREMVRVDHRGRGMTRVVSTGPYRAPAEALAEPAPTPVIDLPRRPPIDPRRPLSAFAPMHGENRVPVTDQVLELVDAQRVLNALVPSTPSDVKAELEEDIGQKTSDIVRDLVYRGASDIVMSNPPLADSALVSKAKQTREVDLNLIIAAGVETAVKTEARGSLVGSRGALPIGDRRSARDTPRNLRDADQWLGTVRAQAYEMAGIPLPIPAEEPTPPAPSPLPMVQRPDTRSSIADGMQIAHPTPDTKPGPADTTPGGMAGLA
jgi:hypothetical protein